ncbi:MAG: DMT family transporter [Gammaproteobacteria bacterium]|nr:DMT family transporter [Gammaproteobacteria bacterium]MCP5416917.1 DMT family transporter [Chromatiaceae bacterium]
MGIINLALLLVLSAIWGGSFLFMRVAAPVLGPALLTEGRVASAALFLAGLALLLGKTLQIGRYWRHYLVLGLFNSALPFLLFGLAAQSLTASLLSILNATTPVWGALIGALWTRQPLPIRSISGLTLGIAGVALLVGYDPMTRDAGTGWAVPAALGASFCYGIASQYAKQAKSNGPFANAHGSMWAATLLIAPVLPLFPANQPPSSSVLLPVIALGVLCSGIAYLIYFRLIEQIGATSALTVTFLIPLFGVLWGVLFLHEQIGWHTIAGSLIVLLGTALVTGFSPARRFPARSAEQSLRMD